MDPGLVGALIGAGAALVGAAIAGAAAVSAINKQARMTLKLDLYREVLKAVEKQGDSETALSTKLRVLNSLIDVWAEPEKFGGLRPVPNTSWSELNELYHRCQIEGAELVMIIERWQIVDPRLHVFRLAFGSAVHDLREAWTPLSQIVGAVVPPVAGGEAPPPLPKLALGDVKTASIQVIDAASKLSAWVSDFQLEMQALCLSELFKNHVVHREPLDPDYFVVRLDQAKALTEYFEKRTAWGREIVAINARTKAILAQKGLPAE